MGASSTAWRSPKWIARLADVSKVGESSTPSGTSRSTINRSVSNTHNSNGNNNCKMARKQQCSSNSSNNSGGSSLSSSSSSKSNGSNVRLLTP